MLYTGHRWLRGTCAWRSRRTGSSRSPPTMTSSDSVRSHPLKYKAPRSTKLEHTSIKKNGLQLSEPPIFNYFFSRIRQEARAEAWYFAHIRYFNGLRTPQKHIHTHTRQHRHGRPPEISVSSLEIHSQHVWSKCTRPTVHTKYVVFWNICILFRILTNL